MSNVKLGKTSKERLMTVDYDLASVILRSLHKMPFDVTILEGIRTKERQQELVNQGNSWTLKSKHLEGRAIDMAPYPVDWNDIDRFVVMADIVLKTAEEMGVKIRWGGDWNQNGDHRDEKNLDGPHFELM